MKDSTETPSGGEATGQPRRTFLARAAAVLIGAAACSVPVVVGIVSFLNPLRQKVGRGGFVRVTLLDVLPEDGTPRKFPIIADRDDAWNHFPNEPIGAVFLRRTGDPTRPVEALNVKCPHAGCPVGYDSETNGFLCACHNARFDLAGKRTDAVSESPRDMDTLDEVEIRNGTEVWVKFRHFRTGTAKKIEEA